MTTQEQRESVLVEARTWLGTSYHHGQCLKGVGVDCVHFPAATYSAALGIDIKVHEYSPQWHLHQTGPGGTFEELYLRGLINQGFVEISDGRDEEPYDATHFIEARKEPADFVVVKLARTYAHGAIILDWPNIIQSEAKMPGRGRVVLATTKANWYFTGRPIKFFSRKEWHR